MDKALDLALAYNNRGLAYHLAVFLLAFLVFVLPALGLALAWGPDYLVVAVFLFTVFLFTFFVFVLPALGLALAYNNRGLAYHLAVFLLAFLVFMLSPLGLALAWGPDYLAVFLLAFLVFALPALGLAYIFRFRGLALAYNDRGFAYAAQGDYDQAIADYTEAIKLKPKDASAYNNRGYAYDQQGDYDQAIKDYDQAIELKPKDAAAYRNRGDAYEKKGRLRPSHRPIVRKHWSLTRNMLQPTTAGDTPTINRVTTAKRSKIMTKPSNSSRKMPVYYNNRGFAYGKKGDYDQAIADYDKALKLDPKYAAAYRNRGDAYEKKKDYDRAIADYDRAIADYDRAIADYDRAIRLKPKEAAAYKVRGDAYEKKGDYDQAIKDYDKALDLNPKYVAAYNNRGYAYDNRGDEGDYDRAIADYDKALELKPKNAVAYNNRGYAYRNRGYTYERKADYDQAIDDYKKAIDDFTKAIKLRPDHATSYLNIGGLYDDLASCYLYKKKLDKYEDYEAKAIEAYDDTVRLCPDYETDFMDSKFAYGGKAAVEEAVQSLYSRIGDAVEKVIAGWGARPRPLEDAVNEDTINEMKASCHPERATYFYYLGVCSLLSENLRLHALKYFVRAKVLGYDDGDNGRKLAKHLENLDTIRKDIEREPFQVLVFSEDLGITEESLRNILRTLTQDRY